MQKPKRAAEASLPLSPVCFLSCRGAPSQLPCDVRLCPACFSVTWPPEDGLVPPCLPNSEDTGFLRGTPLSADRLEVPSPGLAEGARF